MLERDSNGNIIGKLPATAKKISGMELLIIPTEGALSEYSPEAYNSVNMFFINAGHKAFVDNFCNREWMEENKALNITEIDGICKIAAEKGEETPLDKYVRFKNNIQLDPNSFKLLAVIAIIIYLTIIVVMSFICKKVFNKVSVDYDYPEHLAKKLTELLKKQLA